MRKPDPRVWIYNVALAIVDFRANNRLNVIVRNPAGSYQPGQFTDLAN